MPFVAHLMPDTSNHYMRVPEIASALSSKRRLGFQEGVYHVIIHGNPLVSFKGTRKKGGTKTGSYSVRIPHLYPPLYTHIHISASFLI